jgi:hypothetical protein
MEEVTMNQSVCFFKSHVLLKISLIFSTLISCYPQSSSNGQNPLTAILPLIILISILLIVFWKKIFKKREGIIPNQFTGEAQTQQLTKNTITLLCSKCSKKYILGEDALVRTSFGMVESFHNTSYSPSDISFIDNSKDPDLVDTINVTWDELDNSTKLSQKVEINRLQSLLTNGRSRWWRCQKCFEIQIYKPNPLQPVNTDQKDETTLDAIVIVFNRDFPTSGQFTEEILNQLTTRGKTYKSWMRSNTPVRIRIHQNAQDQMTVASIALVEFRKLIGDKANPRNIQFGTFEGSKGIFGSVLSHWH